jgi:hypothetical protein
VSNRLALYLTVRVECDAAELARHLVSDPVEQQRLATDLDAAAEALEYHLVPMLEEPSWDSPSELTVVAVVREERDSE